MYEIIKIVFDGIMVCYYDNTGKLVAHSFALSGNPGMQNLSNQNLINY